MSYKTWKDQSRGNWCSKERQESASHEDIQTGALQRIADATEKMASNYTQLQNDRDLYERWWKEERERNAKLARRISALQGVITKLKRKQ